MRNPRALSALAALAIVATPLAACGNDNANDPSASDTRTITVTMKDNTFTPGKVTAEAGETIAFLFVNEGASTHEAYLGSEAEQEEHAEEMAASSTTHSMDMGSDATGGGADHSMHMGGGDMATVAPGNTVSLTHTFDEAGTMVIGCHQPGHWEAGMKATVEVR